ncbi:hypothetical protein C0993_005428 [Termitomyces sp. T159_Od127]|nr:hypothetical protein C0993_005428 [Termitomyces sp. T159_Od127]
MVMSAFELPEAENFLKARSIKQPDHDATNLSLMELDSIDMPSAYKNQDRDIEVSPSDLPATRSYLSKRKSGAPRFRPCEVGVDEHEYVASSSQASGSRQVRDGDATRALELQVGLSSDPISDSSPPPEGHVKGIVRQIENNQQKSRYLDLRAMQSRSHGIKGSMKNKNPARQKATGLPVDETVAPLSKYSSSLAERLWIKKWICGAQLKENPKNCFVAWEQRTLTIWEGDQKIIWFKLIEELSCVEYCEGEPFTFKLKSKVPSRSTSDPRNQHWFKMGDLHMLGECVIWAEKREDVEETYTSFISWLKKHKQKSTVLRGTAGLSMWEQASRGAELAAGVLGRQSEVKKTDKVPPENFVSLEDSHDSEPSPVAELLQNPPSQMKTSVLSSRPASHTM